MANNSSSSQIRFKCIALTFYKPLMFHYVIMSGLKRLNYPLLLFFCSIWTSKCHSSQIKMNRLINRASLQCIYQKNVRRFDLQSFVRIWSHPISFTCSYFFRCKLTMHIYEKWTISAGDLRPVIEHSHAKRMWSKVIVNYCFLHFMAYWHLNGNYQGAGKNDWVIPLARLER